MNTRHARALVGLAAASLAVGMASSPAQAIPAQGEKEPAYANRAHDLPNPLGDALREKQRQAIDAVIQGDATVEKNSKGERVIKLKGSKSSAKGKQSTKDKYVAWPVTRKESIFTVLTDFGAKTDRRTGGDAGPAHNQIASPDRTWDGSATDDNSTYWLPDFNRAHYQQMMFGTGESFKDFYAKQSNGRFEASGDVSDWVTVPFNEARYGHNPVDGDGTSEAEGYWNYVKDTATAWYDAQKAAGQTDAQIADYLKQFDQVDRYDYDGDGNFNEPDGYIDHFQAIHAGEGEEAGGGAQGDGRHLVAPLVRLLQQRRPHRPGTATSSAACRSAAPASGSVTTPPSPRTAAWACSPTSSATTSACPTSTTPPVATTAPASGP